MEVRTTGVHSNWRIWPVFRFFTDGLQTLSRSPTEVGNTSRGWSEFITLKSESSLNTDMDMHFIMVICSFSSSCRKMIKGFKPSFKKYLISSIKKPLDESERGEWKSWPKAQLSENEDHGIRSHHFVANRWGNSGNSGYTLFFWAPKSLQMVIAAMKFKGIYSLEGKLWPT